ncbi:MAG: MBOAT family protein [Bacilli bacterium]|nr:MBOAT family protein [Bacilli bacterium]MDD4808485.1 MBOAT family protein [Bacilli bacterium]
MVFSSIPFLFFFFPLCLLLYYLVPFKFKNTILLIFSLLFYAWGEPIYIFLMLFSTFVDYLNGRLFENKKFKHKKLYLIIALTINLSLLGFFKYSDFLIEVINGLFGVSIPLLHIGLPIGISFYTFQTMSYSIDVYRGKVKPEKNFFAYLTYISMFPQLIAGPIVRYETINQELHYRELTMDNFTTGLLRFMHGLFKKVLIANNVGYLWSIISTSTTGELSVMTAWLGILAFSFQIYFDFSGYSDMAIGMGKMLGFNYLENFNYPYIATSITDFWRRWHISLSTWFRDYVYIPLGGSRVKKMINIRNIFIVWSLTGIWHGAAWNFIIWGMYYGILLLLEKFILNKYIERFPNWLKHTYTLFLVTIGWVIFAFDDMSMLNSYLGFMFGIGMNPLIDSMFLYYFSNYFFILLIAGILSTPIYQIIKDRLLKIDNKRTELLIFIIRTVVYLGLLIITTSYLVADTYNPFLYFRF